jgi:hypothetical protein
MFYIDRGVKVNSSYRPIKLCRFFTICSEREDNLSSIRLVSGSLAMEKSIFDFWNIPDEFIPAIDFAFLRHHMQS